MVEKRFEKINSTYYDGLTTNYYDIWDNEENKALTIDEAIEKLNKLVDEVVMDASFKKIKDNRILNECIIELMGESYQTRVLGYLEDEICINKYGRAKFDDTLNKYGIKQINTHGFKEYWMEDKI